MSHEQEQLDRLVSRRLDGMLSDDEQLDLDRALIRSPEARRMMDASQQIDRLAGEVLGDLLGGDDHGVDFDSLPMQKGSGRSTRHVWIKRLIPGAIAAAILAVFFARIPASPKPTGQEPIASNRVTQPIPRIVSGPHATTGREAPMRTVGNAAPAVKRNAGRDIFGVMGENGNIYWIEVDRSRTVRRARGGPRVEF